MLQSIIEASVRYRLMVIALSAMLLAIGLSPRRQD